MAIKGLSLSIQSDKNINYVNYQAYLLQKEASPNGNSNQFCFLKSIFIKNEGEEDIRDATLRFEAVPSFLEITNIPIACIEKGKRQTVINRFQIFLDPKKLYEITETIVGSLRVTLFSKTGEMLATSSVTLHFNAIEESASNNRINDILASFVTPNDDSIQTLIPRIAEFKKEKYGDSSFDAYLSHDPNEVLKDVEAVYSFFKNLNIRYIISPSSYEKLFQRVRLPNKTLLDKMGNCLDISLLFASLFEAIGLRPMLIMLNTHCMVGVWLDEEEFAMPIEENGQLVINAASKGFEHLCLIDAVAISSDSDVSFQEAKDSAYKKLEEEKNFRYALDIRQCRNELIWPIPSMHEENGEKVIVIPSLKNSSDERYSKVDLSARRYIPSDAKKNKSRYDYWEDKLLDLNLANKLINLKIRANTLQVMVDDAEKFVSFLHENSKISLAEVDLNMPIEDKEIASFKDAASISLIKEGYGKGRISSFSKAGIKSNVAKNLSRKANTSLEESGCNPLFITIGLIRWYDTESSANHQKGEMYAPLVLLPVKMPRRKNGLFYSLDYDFDDVSLNRTAFEYFKENFHLDFSSLNELPKKDDGNIDLRLIFNEIRRIISPMKNWLLIEEPTFLSLFSFAHFVMWSDLRNNREAFMEHKIISSFVNNESNWVEDTSISNNGQISNSDVIFPLSADSSQIQAIYDAEKGESFILDGPPGTGKSQTIANMIVNFLYHGKTVLFVAEKEVALDVVKRRLDDLSLGQFVLELANIQEPKSQVLETYSKLMNNGPLEGNASFLELNDKIEQKSKELNDKISSIHEKGEFLLSPYEAIISYLENENNGDVYYFSYDYLSNLTQTKYEKTLELLDYIGVTASNFDSYVSSPFLPYQSRDYSIEHRDSLKKELENLLPLLEKMKLDTYNLFSKNKCLEETRNNARRFLEILEILRNGDRSYEQSYLDESLIENEEEVRKAIQLQTEIVKKKEKILVSWKDDFLKQDASSLNKEYDCANSLSFFKRRKANKILKNKLKQFAKDKTLLKGGILKENLDLLETYQREKDLYSRLNAYSKFFVSTHPFNRYPDGENVLKEFETTLKIAKNIQNMDYIDEKKEEFVSYISDLDQGTLFSKTVNKFIADSYLLKEKEEYLSNTYNFQLNLYPDNDKYFGVTYSKIRTSIGSIGSLAEWTSFLLKLDEGEELVGKEYLSLFKEGKINERILKGNFQKSLSFSILSDRLKKDNLGLLSGKEMDDMVRSYAKDVEEFSSLAITMTAAKVSANYPRNAEKYASSTVMNQLMKLAKNGGRGVSLRQIFHNFKDAIKMLTPCFMMSPTSVSQFLDVNDYKFDVVIFDEASQIPTSEAVPSIARARSVIIAGDEEQMPPTSFFTTSIGSNDDGGFASLNEDLESLLDDALILGLPRKRLLWHYRSRHESLIAFSNNKFYDNSLFTFPSPKNDIGAISYRYVKGSYERGRGSNRLEAKEVVAEIIRRLSDKNKRSHSIGVITFNEAQQNVIEDMLDKELSKNPALNIDAGGEKIFVKNLENVQGDERDVILFSTTYGPDKNGTISLNFGPLSLKKGERRLNVAVSRAREEMVVFSSIEPSLIRADKAKNEGAQYLKDFLTFAKQGYDYLPVNAMDVSVKEDGIERFLANDLRNLGYVVKENLGESSFKIDLAVSLKEDPENYVLGVLIDNENFANMTCRDRHINEPNILNSLGWNIFRVYSVEYLDHREEIVQRIVAEINRAKNEPHVDEKKKEKMPKPLFIKQVVIKKSIPYSMIEPQKEPKMALTEFLQELINVEQPISRELIYRRYCDYYDKKRVGSNSRAEIERALNELSFQITHFVNETVTFYVPKSFDEGSFRNYRVDEQNISKRTLSDICYQELANAAADILKEQGEMSVADLAKQISLAFGYKTLPQSKNVYIQKAINDSNCKRNRIRIRGDRVSLAQ